MKRKPRESWATRKLPPLTIEETERHLDLLARLIVKAGKNAKNIVPIYKRVESERDKLRDTNAVIAAARERVRRLSGETEARS